MWHLDRTEKLLGAAALKKLRDSRVAVFGLGGVGSYAAEALSRSGVGSLVLIDGDLVDISNVNRQLYALRSTVGMPKVEAAAKRIADIDPEIELRTHRLFFLPGVGEELLDGVDFIVDAIDTVTAKLHLAGLAQRRNIGIISAMGTGNKLDPGRLKISDIKETSVCPLCRVMRRELKARGIHRLTVVWSDEKPRIHGETEAERRTPASCAFVPGTAGLMMAAHVVRTITGE